jgi:hypothetical protein
MPLVATQKADLRACLCDAPDAPDAMPRVDAILDAAAAAFRREFLEPCGWRPGVADDARIVVHRTGRTLRLCWPWEIVHAAPADEAAVPSTTCLCAHAPDAQVVRERAVWAQRRLREAVCVEHAPILAPGAQGALRADSETECERRTLVDLASRATDPERHATFCTLRRLGVHLVTLPDYKDVAPDIALLDPQRETEFCCNADAAVAVRCGVVRAFVPTRDPSSLRAYVSTTDASILHGTLDVPHATAGGVVRCRSPIAPVGDDGALGALRRTNGAFFCHSLSDADVLCELRLDDAAIGTFGARLRDRTYLRTWGITDAATRSVWPYRQAFCASLAAAIGRPLSYAEFRHAPGSDAMMICLSAESVVFTPERIVGAPRVVATHDSEGDASVMILWDGTRWAILCAGEAS